MSWSNWNWKYWFLRRGKNRRTRRKNLSEQRRGRTRNSTHKWRRRRDLNPGHIGGRRALSPLRCPLLPSCGTLKNPHYCAKRVGHIDPGGVANLYGLWDLVGTSPGMGPISPVRAHSPRVGLCPKKLAKKKTIVTNCDETNTPLNRRC